jgi:hypothetical protein
VVHRCGMCSTKSIERHSFTFSYLPVHKKYMSVTFLYMLVALIFMSVIFFYMFVALIFMSVTFLMHSLSVISESLLTTNRYSLGTRGEYKFYLEKVDSINEPAMVIPTSLNKRDYQFHGNIAKRREVMFTSIPFGFLFRDDWGDGINHGLNDIHRNFKAFKPIRDSWGTTDGYFEELKATFLVNGAGGRRLTDEDAIEEYEDEPERYTNNYLVTINTH